MLSQEERQHIKHVVENRDFNSIQEAIASKQFRMKTLSTKAVDKDTNEISFVVSQDSVDRDSERILPSAFEKDFHYYLENPIVLYNHNSREPAVGRMVNHSISEKDVTMRIKFAVEENPQAEILWKLYSADPPYMRMVSIGFIPLDATDSADMKLDGQKNMTFTRIEMLELSLVNIGANRNALSLMSAEKQGGTDLISKSLLTSDIRNSGKSWYFRLPELETPLVVSLDENADEVDVKLQDDAAETDAVSDTQEKETEGIASEPEAYEKRKFYVDAPIGTLEHRRHALFKTLEKELDGYAELLATYTTHVLVCEHSSKKKDVYWRVEYSYDETTGEVALGDITEVEIIFEPVSNGAGMEDS